MSTWHDLSVDHDSAVPLHTQLQRQFRELIHSGHWLPGSRLPSESQLQQNLNISRNTVRQALQDLVNEGLVERIPGRGTFVARVFPRRQNDRLIALVTSEFESELDLLIGAEQVSREKDCFLVFYNHRGNYREEWRILSQLEQQNVSGVLLWSSLPPGAASVSRLAPDFPLPPLVMVDRNTPGLPTDFITSDNVAGGGLAVRHLQQLGHRRIVCLTHDVDDILTVAERIRGYRAAMEAAGDAALASTWILPTGGELSLEDSQALSQDLDNPAMLTLMERLRQERPGAIFAINDNVALLVLRATQALGWQVPGDLSVVGFDNVDFGSLFTPPLTTVGQDFRAIGRQGMELLLERMEDPSLPPRTLRVPVTLYERATTGRSPDQS